MERESAQITDEWLVLSAQAGDREALRSLVRRWQPKLLAHAGSVVGERDAALDVVQESWISILRSLHRLSDPAAFRGWAYRIVHARSVDRIRSDQRQRKAMDDLQMAHAGIGQTGTDARATWPTLAETISALDGDQKLLLRMYYLERMSVREIAAATETPEGTVKYRLFQIRKRIREQFEGDKQ